MSNIQVSYFIRTTKDNRIQLPIHYNLEYDSIELMYSNFYLTDKNIFVGRSWRKFFFDIFSQELLNMIKEKHVKYSLGRLEWDIKFLQRKSLSRRL